LYNSGENTIKGATSNFAYDLLINFTGGHFLSAPLYGEDFQSMLGIQHGINNADWFKK
jgi:hypothetical protein